MQHEPALDNMTPYTIQEIDNCEYILYRVFYDSKYSRECRLIHKANCKAH